MEKFEFGQIMAVVQWWSKGFVRWWATSCTSNLAVPRNAEVTASYQTSFTKWKGELNQAPTLPFLHDLPLTPCLLLPVSPIHILHYISIFKIALAKNMCIRYINMYYVREKKLVKLSWSMVG